MRWAFVVQLGSRTQSTDRQFEGWIEEVDTGRERRFQSTEELLQFLAEGFELARRDDRQPKKEDERNR